MFWGLIMEPKRRYTQVVKKAFHISMASLDISSGNNEPTQVLLTYDGRNYLLCTLQKGKDIQVPLDLNFDEGNEVSFATNGSCHVHLTGYLITEEEDAEDEEDDIEDKKETKMNNAVKEVKKSAEKKKRKGSEDGSPNVVSPKKTRTAQLLEEVNSDSDDSDDLNFSDILKEGGIEEESDDDENEEESSDEDEVEESEDDENEEDGAEEESSLSDDAFEPIKPSKVNGVTPKKKEKKQKQEKTPKENQQKTANLEITKTPNKEITKTPKEGKSAQKEKKGGEKTPGKEQQQQTPKSKNKTLEGGVQIQDIVVGNGQLAKPGKFVQVYYEGRLKNNNKVFDSVKQGSGFKFRLGSQEVIKGWDVGVQGMKVGGKRRIVCPPNMAYGQKGSPPVIPSNSTLIFEVELKNVH